MRRRKRQLASTGEYISGWGSREWRIDPPAYVFAHLGFLFAVPGLQTVLGLHPVLFLGDRDGARCCWLVFDITDSAFLVGVTAAARMAPLFFLGIFSGTMADWLERWLKKCLNFPRLCQAR